MKSGIYSITCLINGKIYIGSSINLKQRWNNHKIHLNNNNHPNKHLQNSWNKYREEYFDWDIIEYCEKEDLIKREQYYIDYMKPEFNISKTAGSILGVKYSIEIYKKRSQARINKKLSKEHCENISKGKIGSRHSIETRQKMSKIKINRIDPNRRFLNEEVIEIRLNKNLSQRKLAKQYGVSLSTISNIIYNKTYKEIKI